MEELAINKHDFNFSPLITTYVNSDIDYIFPLLNKTEKDLIKQMNNSLLVLIYHRFHFDSEDQFYKQLSENNNQDIRMILFLLFPYINDIDNFRIHKSILFLKDLSLNPNNTNIQYDRYFDSEIEYEQNKYEYNILDVYNNYIASYDTIYKCAHHLYCNWYQVIPLTLNNYRNSYIYLDTIDNFTRTNMFNDNTELKGLTFHDFYHAFINDMYLDVLKYKWLMYERYDETLNKDIMFVEEILNHFTTFDNQEHTKLSFIENWSSFTNQDIIYNILLHFDLQSHKYLSDKSLKSINKQSKESDVYNLDHQPNREETFKKLKETYNINKSEIVEGIYSYLYNTLNEFSHTWYGKMMFPKKIFTTKELVQLKDIVVDDKKIFNIPIHRNSYLSYKNIYNFIKSLLYNGDKIHKIREWESLDYSIQDTIKERLVSNNWLRISNNLRIKYGSSINTRQLTQKIHQLISENIIDLVFHVLVSRGILNEFKVKHKKEKIEESFEGYYFLTQSKYTELNPYLSDKNSQIISFRSETLEKTPLKKLFAMNWLQQIHFFKHFYNQRVMFVTGGTGTGKSTQVPKLLLYGLFLLGNYSGKVINTQPRINATTNNAKRISHELGVPIEHYDPEKNKKEKTTNFYIQYSSEKDKHLTENSNEPSVPSYLKIVTDGTLLATVRKSNFLKETYKEKNKLVELEQNEYDIISIDEAHEHNKNMDLLLTFLRDTVQLNNSLRLVIITATIDEDEPIYRRYYKYINDNLLYPLNYSIFLKYENIQILNQIKLLLNINESQTNFDRISLDRRLHISPPQGSTNHVITEYYQEKPVNTYEESERLGILKAIELTKYATGEILFFSITENKINEIVTILNSQISPKWIALPYYRTINSDWKEIIEKINTSFYRIDVDKKDILKAVVGEEYTKTSNKYERAIIVCTNIAEASITIDSLKFVIETGYSNVVEFDPILEIDKNGPEKISEASRIQRRGRVGRTQSGTVYYMYEKNSRKDISIKYQITQQINTLVYDLINYISEDTTKQWILPILNNKYVNELDSNIIKEQYQDYDIIRNNIYLGNKNNQYVNYSFKLKTGYSYQDIFDGDGKFYIIHPLELLYKKDRDRYTGLFNNPNPKKMKDFVKFFSHLFSLRLIADDNINQIFIKTKIYSIYDELIEKIQEIMPKNELNYNKLITMILGATYNKLDEILFINTIIPNMSISNLSRKQTSRSGSTFSDSSLLIKNFGDTKSDIQVYLNIFNKLKLILPHFIQMDIGEIDLEFQKSEKNKKSILSIKDFEILKNYEKRNRDKRQKVIIYKNRNNIDIKKLELWCDQYGLDSDVINDILQKYLDDSKVINFINEWVAENKQYIPYFSNILGSPNCLEFIYISGYVNYSIKNIDYRQDYNKIEKDPNSIVNGNKIIALTKEKRSETQIIIKNLIRFDTFYVPAIIPIISHYVKNNLLTWESKNFYYNTVTSDMIEPYILPNIKDDDAENQKTKIYNNKLLALFRLLRSNL